MDDKPNNPIADDCAGAPLTPQSRAILESRVRVLSVEIDKLVTLRCCIERKLTADASPFKLGSVIRWPVGADRTRFHRGRVIEIVRGVGDVGRWKIQYIRADGSAGSTRSVWGWDNPELDTAPPGGKVSV